MDLGNCEISWLLLEYDESLIANMSDTTETDGQNQLR